MTPQTFYSVMNSSSDDFSPKYDTTLSDAIDYAEFEEALHSWEHELED